MYNINDNINVDNCIGKYTIKSKFPNNPFINAEICHDTNFIRLKISDISNKTIIKYKSLKINKILEMIKENQGNSFNILDIRYKNFDFDPDEFSIYSPRIIDYGFRVNIKNVRRGEIHFSMDFTKDNNTYSSTYMSLHDTFIGVDNNNM